MWAALLCLTLITLIWVDDWWKIELSGMDEAIAVETAKIAQMEEVLWMLPCPVVTVFDIPYTRDVHIRLICPKTAYVED